MSRFVFDEERLSFARSVRDALARLCPPSVVRAAWTSETGRSPELWKQLVELGLVGAMAPEPLGLGMRELDLVLVLEECGRAALPEPIVETSVVVSLLRDARETTWLPRIADGAIATLGLETLVPDAHVADVTVLARDGALHLVSRDAVRLTPEKSVDGARRLFRVEWSSSTQLDVPLSAARDRAAFATSAFLVGVARKLLQTTVEYVKIRHQFGQPIGSFQAVKHHLADVHVAIELAAPLVHRAAHSLTHGDRDATLHVSMAKAAASDAALLASRAALQCHGAIGYSFEHDLHLWMKRAWVLAASHGDAAYHRGRLADAILTPVSP